jgi:hypothetical protein
MQTNLTSEQVHNLLQSLSAVLAKLKKQWDDQNPGNKSWYKFSKTYLISSTVFLIGTTDSLVQTVEKIIPSGPDKKAAVLIVTANLFDYVSLSFPLWLKPFTPLIKEIIVSILVSNLIEFIVAKYREGSWNMEDKNGEEKKDQTATLRP